MGYTLRRSDERKDELLKELDRVVGILKTRNIEKVILFGSLVRGDVASTSDIDLIIVADTDKRFLDRLDEVYSAVLPQKAMDILVYTPQEIDCMKETNPFLRKALGEGKVLYERNS